MPSLPNESLIMFDLDGTLSESKSAITSQMADVLASLMKEKKIAIISGGAWVQFEKQVISHLPDTAYLKNLFVMPTSGTQLYVWNNGWSLLYAENLDEQDKESIVRILEEVVEKLLEKPKVLYGKQIEDRGSQISFSALGQEAPVSEKQNWDPDQTKRLPVLHALQEQLPSFEIRLGGMTTIDITKKGQGKAYGIKKISKYLGIPLSEIIYIGDALYEGGNDYAAKEMGLAYIQVKDEKETLTLLKSWVI